MIKTIKQHKILALALVGYVIVFAMNVSTGLLALYQTKYYVIEMIKILPAIFVLTSLIQTWIPTQVILKHFGDGSGIKGKLTSLIIGSLSAGPIYAAFPICKTLLKKGASVENITIILSSWAVIKVPMLINEAKFMGVKYMLVRWILTVLAIFFMATTMKRLVPKDKVIVEDSHSEIYIDNNLCIGCGYCAKNYPSQIIMAGKKARIVEGEWTKDTIKVKQVRDSCPVGAIL